MSLPEIGQFLDLLVPEGTFKGQYQCQIQDIDKRWLHIDIPINIDNSVPVLLPEGTRVTVAYTDSRETPCQFDSIVEGNLFRKAHLIAIKVPKKEDILRTQRREYVRVPVTLPVELLVMELESRKLHNLPCTTQNLSGGGLCVILRHDHPVRTGDLVGVQFQFRVDGKRCDIVTKARALKVQASPDHRFRKVCSLQFVDIKESDRKRIVQFVFQRQIELRERGLLRNS